ncbi:probable indole-3-acetic acid-amido synthetase GH3.6 isoform X2 [Neltuma alba]|uniref:probable indole-3-acetic acid-amido synthetase GH3.6 isoform X2 n=1 Tax=Neltuma alba TaxID=207710 RepID=UPI0010A2BDE2|nr:probable indole-3-acetic acid-amido synthetase GH3.6 isoform X2 [Prosopis alba]XP_028804256.1 probable indole-3-acetic acid-amido synthetase GH3.6 isoform X2 [Prosopis alba]
MIVMRLSSLLILFSVSSTETGTSDQSSSAEDTDLKYELCVLSSGTSSLKPKLIPHFDSNISKAASFIAHRGSVSILQRLFRPRPTVNKILLFLYADSITRTKSGLKVMAASSFPLQRGGATSQQFASFSSPLEVILGSNAEHQMYCHLLCGLRNFNVIDAIAAPYAAGLIRAFNLLESKWEQLCADLDRGLASDEILEVSMKESVRKILDGPQPELSRRVRLACEGNDWDGIVSRLWPNARYIKCVTTGCMKQYYPKLKCYAGEVPILGGDYLASECCVGINLDIKQAPETTKYVMLPTAAYFEFLPFNMNQGDDYCEETVDFSDVELGKMYEVVATTYKGLYRYRLGDIVRVVGFHNSSPLVEFVMRAPKTHSEIVTEKDLISAVENFQLALRTAVGIEIVEFSSFSDDELKPKQLKLFVEVKEGHTKTTPQEKWKESVAAFQRCSSSLERGLGAMYSVQRDKGEVGPLLILILRPGAFDRLSEVAIKNGASASQYKPPKIIRNREVAKLLESFALVTVSLDG